MPRKRADSRKSSGVASVASPNARRGELPWARALAALMLLVSTLAIFAPARDFGLVDYDDSLYVTEVPLVQRGLTEEGVRWAFTTFQAGNWHPLTWLSLMADTSVFGQDPKYLHRTNIALHVANALLLFAILGWATRAWTRSFFTAELFAIHPLHVESVVWVAERKDVLSAFFGLAAIGVYVAYARRPSFLRYGLLCASFALSLLAKPMWVTLPVLLLLLDVWPLGRLAWPISFAGQEQDEAQELAPACEAAACGEAPTPWPLPRLEPDHLPRPVVRGRGERASSTWERGRPMPSSHWCSISRRRRFR